MRISMVLPALLLLSATAQAETAEIETTEQIRACLQRNLPAKTSLQRIEIESEDRAGGRRSIEARVHWKRFGERARAMIRVDGPREVKGAAYLLIEGAAEDDVYVYMPALKKVRRVTMTTVSNQLWGTDFSHEDMKHIQGLAERGQSERLEDALVDERAAFVLQTRPDTADESAYERVLTFVDRDTCLMLRSEFFERGDEPRKVLEADPASITQEGELWSARAYTMRDRENETTSWLRVLESDTDGDLPDRLFNPSRLGKGR